MNFEDNVVSQYPMPELRQLLITNRSIPCVEVEATHASALEPLPSPDRNRIQLLIDPSHSWLPPTSTFASPFFIETRTELRMFGFPIKGSSLPVLRTRIEQDSGSDIEMGWIEEGQHLISMQSRRRETDSEDDLSRIPELRTYSLPSKQRNELVVPNPQHWSGAPMWEGARYSFCPYSGRVCYTSDHETIFVFYCFWCWHIPIDIHYTAL
jgi:hypothetical protein